MSRIEHRDMTPDERCSLQEEAGEDQRHEPGWSSQTVAAAILMGGSFMIGMLMFGLPLTMLFDPAEGTRHAYLVLFVPALLTMLLGGTWSVVYYLRGSWRVRPELLEDLDYGRVEVVYATAREAWLVDAAHGLGWLLDLDDEVLYLGPDVASGTALRTFPGRRVTVVRGKHSGLVLEIDTEGSPIASSGRVREPEWLDSRLDSALFSEARINGWAAEVRRAG